MLALENRTLVFLVWNRFPSPGRLPTIDGQGNFSRTRWNTMVTDWLSALQHFADSATAPTYDSLWKLTVNLGAAASLIGSVCAGGFAVWRFAKHKWRTAIFASVTAVVLGAVTVLLYAGYERQLDEGDWQLAQSVNTERAYEVYEQRHPAGAHADEARQQIAVSNAPVVPRPAQSPPAAHPQKSAASVQRVKPVVLHRDSSPDPSPPPGTLKTFLVGDATVWLLSVDPHDVSLHDGKAFAVGAGLRVCCGKKLHFWVEPVIPDATDGWIWSANDCHYNYDGSGLEASNAKLIRSFVVKGECENAHLTAFRFTVSDDSKNPDASRSYDLPVAEVMATNP